MVEVFGEGWTQRVNNKVLMSSPVLKPCVPYMKRAEELENDTSNPDGKTIAYFCKLYAIVKAFEVRKTKPEAKAEIEAFVIPLLEETEGIFSIYICIRIRGSCLSLPPNHFTLMAFVTLLNTDSCQESTSRHLT